MSKAVNSKYCNTQIIRIKLLSGGQISIIAATSKKPKNKDLIFADTLTREESELLKNILGIPKPPTNNAGEMQKWKTKSLEAFDKLKQLSVIIGEIHYSPDSWMSPKMKMPKFLVIARCDKHSGKMIFLAIPDLSHYSPKRPSQQ